MNYYKIILVFILGSIIPLFHINGFAIPKEDALVYKSMKNVSYSMQKKYRMTGGFCGSGKDEAFWKFTLLFKKKGSPITLEEARKLLVSCSQDILDFINQEDKIRPYLRDFPFTPKNISVIISFYTKEGDSAYYPYIGSMSASGGRLHYSTFEPGYLCKEKTSIEETYEEGLAIVRGEANPNIHLLKKDDSQ